MHKKLSFPTKKKDDTIINFKKNNTGLGEDGILC